MKLLHDQLVKDADHKNDQITSLKDDYEKLASRLPEFGEMKVSQEGLRLQTIDLQRDNQSKAAYISGLQMKLVLAMSELERLRVSQYSRPMAMRA
jgi:SMC interacting uncharacterized protein involved in chromosome segregation